eukprot:5513260-Amphidinium_carterae.1
MHHNPAVFLRTMLLHFVERDGPARLGGRHPGLLSESVAPEIGYWAKSGAAAKTWATEREVVTIVLKKMVPACIQ